MRLVDICMVDICMVDIYEEKLGNSMWSLSWLGQKVNKIESKSTGVAKLIRKNRIRR